MPPEDFFSSVITNAPTPGDPGVWPPPPLNRANLGADAVEVAVGFRTEFRFVAGSVPNFRHGTVRLSSEGLLLEGQAVMPYEYQLPIFIVGLFLPPLWLISYLVMEYGLRHLEMMYLSWDQVRRIAFVNEEQLVCIVYDARNFRGKEKVYSLTFPLNKAEYEAFIACGVQYWPEKVGESKLRRWTSPINWAFCLSVLIFCAALGARLIFETIRVVGSQAECSDWASWEGRLIRSITGIC